jgi:hypothetical protein
VTAEFTLALVRHGGFAGITMRAEIHSHDLSAENARELWQLAKAPPLSHADESARSGHADSFTYRLTVTTPQDSRDYTFTEAEIGADMRPLIQRLERDLAI